MDGWKDKNRSKRKTNFYSLAFPLLVQPNKQRKKENEIAAVFLIAPRALLTEAEMVMDWHGLSIYKHQKPLGLASVRALTSPLAKMKAAIEQSVRCVSS